MTSAIEPKPYLQRPSTGAPMPEELVLSILSLLPLDELIKAREVCRQFRELCDERMKSLLQRGFNEGPQKSLSLYYDLSVLSGGTLTLDYWEKEQGYPLLAKSISDEAKYFASQDLTFQNIDKIACLEYKKDSKAIQEAIAAALKTCKVIDVVYFVKTWHELKGALSKRLASFNYRLLICPSLVELIRAPKTNLDQKIVKFFQLWLSSQELYGIAEAEILEEQKEIKNILKFEEFVLDYPGKKTACDRLTQEWQINGPSFSILANRLKYFLRLMTETKRIQLLTQLKAIIGDDEEYSICFTLGIRRINMEPIQLTTEQIESLANLA